MRSLVLLRAWTLSLSQLFQVAVSEQGVNPATLIPLLSHKSTGPAKSSSTIDPLEWTPDEPAAVPDSSSSSSTDGSNGDSSNSTTERPGSSSEQSSYSGDDDIVAPESVMLPAPSSSTSSSVSASSGATRSSVVESACAGTQVSVETVVGVFCIDGNSVCSGGNGGGACPGVQPGLPTGSHCAEVWDGVYGCRPGPKSALGTRLRQ